MRNVKNKSLLMLMTLSVVMVLGGCTNWQKKYKGMNVEHQNLKGLYENCVSSLDASAREKAQMGSELVSSQQTIEELQMMISKRNISPAEAAGFGKDMDVTFDPTAGTITVTLPNAILFSPGKASLKKASITELNHVLSVLQERYGDKTIDIVGHTDSDPIKKSKWQDNWQLSAERALSVLRYMNKKGIKGGRIVAVAAGEGRPVSSNSTSSGKARNRRVEIVVNMR
jgi:chemotaxis protein MotB